MAFQVRCNFNRIESYAQAFKAWHKGVIFPKDREGPRGLVDRRKKHMTVEKTGEAEDITLRLYDAPIVTWHKDNSVTVISARPSRSTFVFARHCMPAGMSARLCGGCFAVDIADRGWRTYRVTDEITFRQRDGTWKADKIEPWMIPEINRELAKQAREDSGYNEFRAWLIVYVQMTAEPTDRLMRLGFKRRAILDLLADRSKWRELAAGFPEAWRDPERALKSLRKAIYHEHGCIEEKSVAFLG